MTTIADAPRTTPVRVGRVVTGLVTAFLTFDAAIHIANIAPVVEGSRTLGFDPAVMPYVGVLELALVGLHLARRTSVVGLSC